MKRTNGVKQDIEKAIVKVAKKTASMEANTACMFFGYQSKVPQEVLKLRKF